MNGVGFSPQRFAFELLLARRARAKPQVIGQGHHDGRVVQALQRRLSDLGYDIEIDGAFGPNTRKAVTDFQKDHGAKADGVVGKETFGKLIRATGRPGMRNPADTGIDAIGRAVGVKGVGGGPSQAARTGQPGLGGTSTSTLPGRFGRSGRARKGATGPKLKPGQRTDPTTGQTYNTKAGQQATAGHPIGQTDPTKAPGNVQTRKAAQAAAENNNPEFNNLHPRAYGGQFAAKGTTGAQAVAVQQHVNAANGDHKLKVDGKFGPKTQGAVKRFQSQHGLVSDGIVGLKTTAALLATIKARRHS